MIYPLNGFEWIWLGLWVAAGIISYYVGGYHNRQKVPVYIGR